jgi:hypothetical protein
LAQADATTTREQPRSLKSAIAWLAREIPDLRPIDGASGATLELSRSLEDAPRTSPAQVIERRDEPFGAIDVPQPREAVTHFLDGIQRSRAIAYVGSVPIVEGLVGAVIRERHERRMRSSAYPPRVERALYAPFDLLRSDTSGALARLAEAQRIELRNTCDPCAAPGEEHPLRFLQLANELVKTERERLENGLAHAFADQDRGSGVLYIDGSIPLAESVSASARILGVIKSHNTLYVTGPQLVTVLSLAEGQRSPVLALEGRRRSHVATWYLRLRDASQQDPFFGLVRIEVATAALGDDISAAADERSTWVLAERSPLSLPDGRWDTMAYGIRDCEKFLRAIAL